MSVSSSRFDPTSPVDVAGATFSTARRGFDQAEVREFLKSVSTEVARLREREASLQREVTAALQRPRLDPSELDEDTVTALLGEETARVLATAREAASQIRARAEDGAARLLREAQEDAARLRAEGEIEAARRRQDAAKDAEAEIETARNEGRHMVNEAREYRERVLADITKRREQAKNQLQELAGGRDRLVQAFERARLVTADVLTEFQELGVELDDEISSGPPTEPVPIIVRNSPPPASSTSAPTLSSDSKPDKSGADGEREANSGDALYDVEAEADDSLELATQPDAAEPAIHERDSALDDDSLVGQDADDVAIEDATVLPDGDPSAAPDLSVIAVELPDSDDSSLLAEEGSSPDVADEPMATIDSDCFVEPVEDSDGSEAAQAIGGLHLVKTDSADADAALGTGIDNEAAATEEGLATVVGLFTREPVAEPDSQASKPTVDDLFARLKASGPAAVAGAVRDEQRKGVTAPGAPEATVVPPPQVDHPVDDAEGTDLGDATGSADQAVAVDDAPAADVDDAVDDPLAERDRVLTPLDISVARRMKRVLADEQNDVLDILRRKEPIRSIEQLMPSADEHLASYRDAVADDINVAAEAGASTQSADPAWVVRRLDNDGVVSNVLGLLQSELVDPLRQRIERTLRDADGDNAEVANHVRTIYREVKSQRLDDLATEMNLAAYGRGRFAAIEPGTMLTWIADPACADLRSNGAAGPVAAGSAFPSGDRFPPTHAACGCLVVPAR